MRKYNYAQLTNSQKGYYIMITAGFTISPELSEQLAEVSARDDRSKSNIVRAALRDYFAKIDPINNVAPASDTAVPNERA